MRFGLLLWIVLFWITTFVFSENNPLAAQLEKELAGLYSYEDRLEVLDSIPAQRLESLIPAIQNDTLKVDLIHAYIGHLHSEIDATLGKEELALSYQLSEEHTYKTGMAVALKYLGEVYTPTGEYSKAMYYLNQSLMLAKQIHYSSLVSAGYKALANLFELQNDYKTALQYHLQSLHWSEKSNDAKLVARQLYNIALFFNTIGNNREAIKYAEHSFRIHSNLHQLADYYNLLGKINLEDKNYAKAIYYLNQTLHKQPNNTDALYYIGMVYQEQQKSDTALYYLEKSLRLIPEKASYKNLRLDAIASIYEQQQEFNKALQYRQQSLAEVQRLHEKITEAASYNHLAKHYSLRRDFKQAISYGQKALQLATQVKTLNEQKEATGQLSAMYAQIGQYDKAYQFHVQYKHINDQIRSDSSLKKMVRMEMEYEFDKKMAAQQSKHIQEDLKNEAKYNQQRYWIYSLSVALLLSALLAYTFYRYYLLKRKDNELLKQLNQKISTGREELALQTLELRAANEEIYKINANLESVIWERTRQLESQNRRLIDYAFFNAHKVRGPLARILGLIYLIKLNSPVLDKDTEFIIDKLDMVSKDLDNVINEINAILQNPKE
jgi:tetratricopeptide (TPR) repeat protein